MACAILIVLGVPFAAFTALLLHHFYISGSFMLDAGWAAYLLTHGGLTLSYPAALGGDSYFQYHVAPLFIALGAFRRAVPVSDIQFFAGLMGLCHALAGAAVFWILYSGFGLRGGIALAAAAVVSVGFAFNGLALAIVRYPHPEMLVVAFVLLFLVALMRRHLVLAGFFLLIALLTREDAGFHVFALLAVVIAFKRLDGVGWQPQRTEIKFAAAALAYGVIAYGVERALSDGTSTMALTYLGDPPFVGLSLERTLLRLQFYAVYRGYIVLPAMVAAIWALRTRNPYIIAGYVAFTPWAVLQLIAHTDIAGTMSAYYAYPFMIASFWPLLGTLLDRQRRGVEANSAAPVAAFAAMVVVSFIGVPQQYNPGRLELAAFFQPPTLVHQATTDRAVERLARSTRELGPILVDTSIVTLFPDGFVPEQTVPTDRPAPGQVDTVALLVHGYDAGTLRRLAVSGGLRFHYAVPGTEIRIISRRPVPVDAPIASMIAATD